MSFLNNKIDNHRQEDADLLKRIRLNDRYAFELIYNKYCNLLFEHAYRIVRDREISMDIVQEIFVWFWTNRELLEINSLKPYLLAAVKFKVANHLRGKKIRDNYILNFQKVQEENSIIHQVSEIKEMKDLIQHLINLLPNRCREVFILSRQQHISNKEIASQLDISEKTVEMHITHALKKLRIGMRDYLNFILLLF